MKWKSLRVPLLIALLISGCGTTGVRHFTLDRQTTPRVHYDRIDLEEYRSRYAGEDGVYFYREAMIEFVGNARGLRTRGIDIWRTEAARYLVLNPENRDLSTVRLALVDGEVLQTFYLTVFSPDGSHRSFGIEDLNVERNSDGSTTYRFALPGLVDGSVVDFGYEAGSTAYRSGYFYHAIPMQLPFHCERLSLRTVYPDTWYVKVVGDVSAESTWTEEKNRDYSLADDAVVASYDADDVPPFVEEPYAPYLANSVRLYEIGAIEATIEDIRIALLSRTWDDMADAEIEAMLDGVESDNGEISLQVE